MVGFTLIYDRYMFIYIYIHIIIYKYIAMYIAVISVTVIFLCAEISAATNIMYITL